MDELKIVISQPFRIRNKARLTPAEFTFALSLDLKWFPPEDGRQIVDAGLRAGLLKEEKGKLVPTFDYRNVAVPPGFRPGPGVFTQKPLMERIIELLARGSGISAPEAETLVRDRQKQLSDLVTPEIAGLIVAREHGLDVSPYIDEAYSRLVKK